MNRKKISSMLLAFFLVSSTLPNSKAFAEEPSNNNLLQSIEDSNSSPLQLEALDSKNEISWYTISKASEDILEGIKQDLESDSSLAGIFQVVSNEKDAITLQVAKVNDTEENINKLSAKIDGKAALEKNESFEAGSTDGLSSSTYLNDPLDSSKYLKVTSLSGSKLIPSITWDKAFSDKGYFLVYSISRKDSSGKESKEVHRFQQLSQGNLTLPEIDGSDLASLTLNYNIVDNQGKVIEKSEETLLKDSSTPSYSITSAACDISSKQITLQITAPEETNLLDTPVVYYGDNKLDASNISYDKAKHLYSIILNNIEPFKTPLASLRFYAADDALNLGELDLSKDFLINFSKTFNDEIMLSKGNVLNGIAPSTGSVSNLFINNSQVALGNDKSFSTNISNTANSIDAKYYYTQEDGKVFPVEITAGIYSISAGPKFSSFSCTSSGNNLKVSDGNTIYVTDKNLTVSGTISDYCANAIGLDSIKYQYAGGEVKVLTKDFYSLTQVDQGSDKLLINLPLENDDDKKLTAVTLEASNDLGYKTSFTFKVAVDDTLPTAAIKYEASNGQISDLEDNASLNSSFYPAFMVSDSNLDLNNSYVKLTSYDGSGNKTDSTSALADLTLEDTDLYVLKNAALKCGKYDIAVHAVDKSGNAVEIKRTIYYDNEAPKITYSGALENSDTAYTSSKKGFVPVITVEDYLLTEDQIKDENYLKAQFNNESLIIDHIESSLDSDGKHCYKVVYKSVNSPASKDGKYPIKIKAVGVSGLSSSSEKNVYFDNQPPFISFWDQNNLLINNNSVISTKAEPVKPTIYVGDDIKISSDSITITKKTPDGNIVTIPSDTLVPCDNQLLYGKFYSSGWTFSDTISDPGEYTITVNAVDAVGNAYESDPYVLHFIVDNSAPAINITGISDGEYSNASSLTALITASDDNFSEGTAVLSRENAPDQTIALDNNKAASINISEEGNYTLTVKAKDAAGNNTTVTRSFCIDRTLPEITSANLASGSYYRKAFDPKFTIKEDNLDKSQSYFSVNKNGSTSKYSFEDSGHVGFNELTAQYTLKNVVNEDGNYSVAVHLADLAGNQLKNGDAGYSFFIQSKAATAAIKNINNNEYFNKAITPEIEITDPYMDESDLNSRIIATLNGEAYKLTNCRRDGLKLIVSGEPIENPKASLGDTYTLKVTTKDRTDSPEVNIDEKTFTIDEAAPTLEKTNFVDKKYYRKAPDPSIELQEKYLDEANSYFLVNKNGVSYKYFLNDNNVFKEYNTDVNTSDYTYTLKNVVDVDGTYQITVHLVDLSGNLPAAGDSNYTIYVDSVPASSNIVNIGDPSEGKKTYFNTSVIPEISVADEFMDESDVNTLIKATLNGKPYKLNFDKKENGVLKLKGDEVKTEEGKLIGSYNLVIYTSDRASSAGEALTTSANFIIDEAKPIIKATNLEDSKYYRHFDNPSVTIQEDYIDLKNSYFSVSKDGGASENYSFDSPNVSKDSSGTYYLNGVVVQDGKYAITIHVQDMAGNNADDVNKTIYIDKHPAIPKIQNIDEGKNYNSQVTGIIKVQDKFLQDSDVNTSRLYATLDGKNINLSIVQKEIDPSTGETIFTLKTDPITSNTARNALYNLKVYALDKAADYDVNNEEAPGTDSRNFVVDTEPAKIFFGEASGRNIEDNGFYNGTIRPVIRLTDNYDVSNYSITLNGNSYGGSIEKTEDGYVFTGDPISGDGLYTLSVTDNDKAQASPTTYQISFTMDNTKPNIDISGVQNNEFNNKNVTTPMIRITDTNLVLENTQINIYKNGVRIPVDISRNDNLFSFNVYDEGTYTFNVTSVDKAGNSYTTPDLTFTIDRTPPTMKFNFTDGDFINKAFAPQVTPDNPDDFISQLLINGQSFDPHNVPILTDNQKYEIRAIAKDKAGNVSQEIVKSFVLDTEAPKVDISGLVSNFYYNRNISPLINYTDTNPDVFNVTLNGQPYNNSVISAEGSYELVVFAEDKARNVTRIVIDFVIDKTAPSITVPTFLNQSTFLSIFTPLVDIDDDNCDKTILLDGNDYHGGPITTDGKHTLLIIAVDKAGNVTKKAFTFYLKATPPSVKITNIIDGRSYDHYVIPEFNISDDAIRDATLITLDGKEYKIGDEISGIGEHILSITVKDSVGNKATKTIKFKIVSPDKPLSARLSGNKSSLLPILGGAAAGIAALGALIVVGIRRLRIKKAKRNEEK